MDCRTARLLLNFARPSFTELEASEVEALEGHLADCSECDSLARTESQVDAHLGRAVRAVPVPEGLRTRLLARLEPRPRYRRRMMQSAGALAAAAAILFAVWLGVAHTRPAVVNTEAVAASVSRQVANPAPGTVQDWFRERGVETIAPDGFNYGLLAYYDLADLQGRPVPFLLFTQSNSQARVYILSAAQFNLNDDALGSTQAGWSGCRFEVRRLDSNPRFAYLIVYTGDSLDQFLTETPRPAT